MDGPYRHVWHPGASCVAPRWPLTPPLLPDELFSSWLTRTALAHGRSLSALTVIIGPGKRAWLGDFDRGIDEALLSVISRNAGLNPQSITASTLLPLAHDLQPPLSRRGNCTWPWMLVIGCRGARHAGGLQCCPVCIANSEPHYVLQARLAWHTGCARHNVQLIDRCPHCLSALQPGLLKPGDHLYQCHRCHQHISDGAHSLCANEALSFQNHVDAMYGRTGVYGQCEFSFCNWMIIARAMLSLAQMMVRQPSKSAVEFCRLMGLTEYLALARSSLGLPFEFLGPGERSGLLGFAWAIMQGGPERFIDAAIRSSLPISFMPRLDRSAPEVMFRIMSSLTRYPAHHPKEQHDLTPRDPSSVLRMWERLQRRIRRDGFR